ncbi:Zinc finger, CCHC-type [Sesbania bispinosa]|nr:Zinc finger, CCHC-type [Sesbania bispinosa]
MDRWKGIEFTEEEEEHVVPLSIPEEHKEAESEALQFCLICKVWKDDSFNVRAFKSTMLNIWKTRGGVEILDLGPNLFSVRLFNEKDKKAIFKGHPWTFDKHVVVMEELYDNFQPSEVELFTCLAQILGDYMGKYEDWDPSSEARWGQFLRIRVRLDLRKPLKRGMLVQLKENQKAKVFFKFEKLLNFCYICGRLGHVMKTCPDIEGDIDEGEVESLPYGEWMRASSIRPTKMAKEGSAPSAIGSRKNLSTLQKISNSVRDVPEEVSDNQVAIHHEKTEKKRAKHELEFIQKSLERVEINSKPAEEEVNSHSTAENK